MEPLASYASRESSSAKSEARTEGTRRQHSTKPATKASSDENMAGRPGASRAQEVMRSRTAGGGAEPAGGGGGWTLLDGTTVGLMVVGWTP